MNTIKQQWVMDVVHAEAKRLAKVDGRTEVDEAIWFKARNDVKTYAARLLAVLAIDSNCTFEDHLTNKGK